MSDISIRDRIQYRKQHAVDPEIFLESAGAIEPTDTDEQLQFTSTFRTEMDRYVEQYEVEGVGSTEIARIFGVPEENAQPVDRPYTAFKVIHTIHKWPSEGALVLDAAADAALRDRTEEWEEVPPRQRYRILQALRSFQDACLFCGDEIRFSETPVESCCGEVQVITLHCDGCERRFLEFQTEEGIDAPFSLRDT